MITSEQKMNSSLKRQLLRTFIQMVDDLKDKKEIEKFLTDFFSEEEFEKYIKRLAIAYWLKKGRDAENIQRNLLATPKEISEAKELLKKEGVKLAIKKIEADEWANVWVEKIKTFGKH
jgi:uncharacterized protein YerC